MSKRLAEAVLKWWQDHGSDTTGEYGEYNIYDDIPDCVQLAAEELGATAMSFGHVEYPESSASPTESNTQ